LKTSPQQQEEQEKQDAQRHEISAWSKNEDISLALMCLNE